MACKGPLDTQRKEMLSFTCRLDPKGYTTTHNVELVLNFQTEIYTILSYYVISVYLCHYHHPVLSKVSVQVMQQQRKQL